VSDDDHDVPEGRVELAFAALGRAIARRPMPWVLALVVSLLPTSWLALSLEVRASFLELLPENERPVRELHAVLDHARSASDVLIAINTEDRALAERFAVAAVEALEATDEVASVGGHTDMAWFRDHQLLFVPESELSDLVGRAHSTIDAEILSRTGLFIDFDDQDATQRDTETLLADVDESEEHIGRDEWIVTNDGRYLCLWAFFVGNSGDIAFGQHAYDHVRATLDGLRDGTRFPRDLEVRYAGGIPTRVDDERAFVEDLRVAGIVGFAAVILLIVASLRSPRALVLLSVPLFIGLVWTFAFARVAVGHLNIVSGFLFSILSGLGIEYAIHLMHRYRELRESGMGLEDTIERLVAKTGRALLSGSMTNASVFAVVAAADFRGFAEFGLIAAVGLLLTLVATLTGLPALLVVFERWRPLEWKHHDEASSRPVNVPAAVRWTTLIVVPLCALVSVWVLATGRVRFDGNWRLLAGNSPTTQFQEYLRHHFAGFYTAGLLYVPNDADLPGVESAFEHVREARTARGEAFGVVEVQTLANAFPSPEQQARRIALAGELETQLDRITPEMLDAAGRDRLAEGHRLIANARPVAIADLPQVVVNPFLTRDGTGSIASVRVRDTDDPNTSTLVSWAAQMEEVVAQLDAQHITAPLLSENWIAGEIFERVAHDARFLMGGTLAAVLLVLLLDFRRPLVALGVLGAVLIGFVSLAGSMWLAHLDLNFMNAAILPICVGISLDNAIHVYHRWREGGPGSIPIVLRHTTAANALASATNLLGFAALGLTHHEGLRSVAWLAILGVLATYASTTLWFPMVLATIDARRAKK
jgi:predicted RND superfamily exporter protein